MRRAATVSPLRTPVGTFGGALRAVPVEDLAATVVRAVVSRSGVDPAAVRTADDLAGLPFTEKQELRDSLAAAPPLGRHVAADLRDMAQVQASSGTTGSPSYVGLTASGIGTNGFRPGEWVLHAFGMSGRRSRRGSGRRSTSRPRCASSPRAR